MKYRVGQSVKIIAPAQDKDTSRIGQTGRVLHGVRDSSQEIVVMFGKSAQTFSVDSVEATQ